MSSVPYLESHRPLSAVPREGRSWTTVYSVSPRTSGWCLVTLHYTLHRIDAVYSSFLCYRALAFHTSAIGTCISRSTWYCYVTGSTGMFWLKHQVWGYGWVLGGRTGPSLLRLTWSLKLSRFWKPKSPQRACPRLVSDVWVWLQTVLRHTLDSVWSILVRMSKFCGRTSPKGTPASLLSFVPAVLSTSKSQVSQITWLFGISPNHRKASQCIPGACAPDQPRKEPTREKQRTDPWLISPFQCNGEFLLN